MVFEVPLLYSDCLYQQKFLFFLCAFAMHKGEYGTLLIVYIFQSNYSFVNFMVIVGISIILLYK